MTPHALILLADVLVWLQGLLPLAVFLLVVFYLLGEQKRKNRQSRRKAPPMSAPLEADRARPAASASRAPRPVRNEEIEEFLRRAAQQRGEAATSAAAGSRGSANRGGMARAEVRSERVAAPAAASAAARKPRSGQPAGDVRQGKPQPSRGSLSEGVSDRLNTKQFDARAAHVAEDLARQDRQREQHLKNKFDTHLGTLAEGTMSADANADASTVSVGPSSALARGVIGLLQGETLRQALVLTEIFHRPVDRW